MGILLHRSGANLPKYRSINRNCGGLGIKEWSPLHRSYSPWIPAKNAAY